MPWPKGRPRPKPPNSGRRAGTPNKSSSSVRESILAVYAKIGGDAAFAKWAQDNPQEYYKIYARVLPVEHGAPGSAENPQNVVIRWLPPSG